MKKYHNIPQLYTALEVKNLFLNHFDPNDLVLHYESDLTGDEFDCHGFSMRTDDKVIVIRSMSAFNAKSIDDFVNKYRIQSRVEYDPKESLKGIIAVIGDEYDRDMWGRKDSPDIKQLLDYTEVQNPLSFLSWGKYEGLCVVSSHPELATVCN